MRHLNRFIYNIKGYINASLSEEGLDPETIAKRITLSLVKEKNSYSEEVQISSLLKQYDISKLIHFTHIRNLEKIINYGLIPREYLEKEAIRVALNPLFSDSYRLDKMKNANCLSISFPNYSMFYSKRIKAEDDWIVLIFKPQIVSKHKCKFSNVNAASPKAIISSGVNGLKDMFFNEKLRKQNDLPNNYTTNPQAELLEFSVISPKEISEIILFSDTYLSKVNAIAKTHDIKVNISKKYFSPRIDYQYWKSRTFNYNKPI